jgi:vanillate O-demethylase ferredoxin subunit
MSIESTTRGTLAVRVASITIETPGIRVFDLRPVEGGQLEPFTAGAHIDVHLPPDMVRSYSLVNAQGETHRYVIAVNKNVVGHGGSRFMHDTIRAGDRLTVSRPTNNFHLVEDAEHVVLIGGGIGITPLWSMAQRLTDLGRPWTLHYSNRTRASSAFLDRLMALADTAGATLELVFSREPEGGFLEIAATVAAAAAGSHLYCCGRLHPVRIDAGRDDRVGLERGVEAGS